MKTFEEDLLGTLGVSTERAKELSGEVLKALKDKVGIEENGTEETLNNFKTFAKSESGYFILAFFLGCGVSTIMDLSKGVSPLIKPTGSPDSMVVRFTKTDRDDLREALGIDKEWHDLIFVPFLKAAADAVHEDKEGDYISIGEAIHNLSKLANSPSQLAYLIWKFGEMETKKDMMGRPAKDYRKTYEKYKGMSIEERNKNSESGMGKDY